MSSGTNIKPLSLTFLNENSSRDADKHLPMQHMYKQFVAGAAFVRAVYFL